MRGDDLGGSVHGRCRRGDGCRVALDRGLTMSHTRDDLNRVRGLLRDARVERDEWKARAELAEKQADGWRQIARGLRMVSEDMK